MIEGIVNAAYEAVVTLPLRGQAGQERDIEAVIDTGYNGFLSLPPALVEELAGATTTVSALPPHDTRPIVRSGFLPLPAAA